MNKKNYPGHVGIKIKIFRTIWNIFCLFLFRPFGTKLFRKWRLFVLSLFGAKISKSAEVYSSAKIWAPWNLRMGDRSCLGPNTICYNQDIVIIEEDAVVSQYSYLCTAGHETEKLLTADGGLVTAPITIREKAWVGTKAFVGIGVEIGAGAVVGATASVYKDVEPWTVVGGNPAKKIKERLIANEQ